VGKSTKNWAKILLQESESRIIFMTSITNLAWTHSKDRKDLFVPRTYEESHTVRFNSYPERQLSNPLIGSL